MITFLLWLVPTVLSTEDIYLGIPFGTLEDKPNRVHADVYIADDHTIAFTNFSYKPWNVKPSCVGVMVGPATELDLQKQVGPGVLLSYSRMNFGWEESPLYRKRRIRSTGKHANGIDEWIKKLELRNPKWRIRLDAPTTAPDNDESYEIVEYVDDEEEIVEEDNTPKREVVVYRVLPQGARHNNQTGDEIRATTAKLTTKPFIITTTKPVIIFDKKNSFKEKAFQQKVNKRFPPMPAIFKTEAPVVSTSKSTTTSSTTTEPIMTTEFLEPILEDLESSTEDDLIHKDVSNFLIPPTYNGKAVFLLTNGAKLTNYKWVGLWNACTKKSTPHIWLDGVDPPREEEIGPLVNYLGYPISEAVRILNCNTLLIPKLFFKPDSKRMNTYFYGGAINNNVEKKIKIKVIGYDIEEPLEEFSGDDIMLRLPKGIRTFDIDFISIFNDDSNKTLAKTDIPSTLVPPCN